MPNGSNCAFVHGPYKPNLQWGVFKTELLLLMCQMTCH